MKPSLTITKRPLSTNPKRRQLAIALLILALYYIGLNHTPLKIAQLKFRDSFYRLRHSYYSAFEKEKILPKDIVIIGIDKKSHKNFDIRWPWNREVFADFLNKIARYNPKVIALDLASSGKTKYPEDDIKLAEAIKRSGNVILVSAFGKDRIYLGPYYLFAKASAGYGSPGAIKGIDGAIRYFRPSAIVFTKERLKEKTFEAKIAAYYLGAQHKNVNDKGQNFIFEAKDKQMEIPLDENGRALINYLSDLKDIKTVSIWKIMKGELPGAIFKDKLLIVCETGEMFNDIHPTPFGRRPGGMIIANVVNSIISSSFLKKVSPKITATAAAFMYMLSFFMFNKMQAKKGLFFLITILTVCLVTSFILFLNNIVLPVFHIVVLLPLLFLGMALSHYDILLFERDKTKQLVITDPLTSLYTQEHFLHSINQAVKRVQRTNEKCSMILVKIVNLDRIIKETSFDKGKTIQQKAAEIVKVKFMKGSFSAHLESDAFGMLLPKIGSGEALGIAGSLRNNIKNTGFGISEQRLKPVVAIGVSSVNVKGFPKTGSELMESAQAALKRARQIGPNRICRFNPKIDGSLAKHDTTEKGIIPPPQADDDYGIIEEAIEAKDKEREEAERHRLEVEKERDMAYIEGIGAVIGYMEEKDPYTAGHSERVGIYAEKIGLQLKLDEDELIPLKEGGILHDLGKIDMPSDILRKKEALKDYEMDRIKLHPEISAKILRNSRHFNKILPILRDHQERIDGSGYPRGLKGDQIPLGAQIVAVADVFDALTSNRSYRNPVSPEKAIEELRSQRKLLNQKIVHALEEVLKEVNHDLKKILKKESLWEVT